MQPLAIITGIVLGTSAAIAIGLSVVLFLFFILADEHPRLASEFGALAISTVIFVTLTAICATSFFATIRKTSWRLVAQASMWLGLTVTVLYYLP